MNNLQLFAFVFCLALCVCYLANQPKEARLVAVPPLRLPYQHQLEPAQPPSKIEQEQPESVKALTIPGAKTYTIAGSTIKKSSSLKDAYFECIILKKLVFEGRGYYVIKITQAGMTQDIWVLDDTGILLL